MFALKSRCPLQNAGQATGALWGGGDHAPVPDV